MKRRWGSDAADAAGRVFDAVMKRLKASPEGAVFVRDVGGKRRQKELRAAVIAHLKSDRQFKKQIDLLMDEFDDASLGQVGTTFGRVGALGDKVGSLGGSDEMGDDFGDDLDVVRGPTVLRDNTQLGDAGPAVAYGQPPGPITIPPRPRPRGQ